MKTILLWIPRIVIVALTPITFFSGIYAVGMLHHKDDVYTSQENTIIICVVFVLFWGVGSAISMVALKIDRQVNWASIRLRWLGFLLIAIGVRLGLEFLISTTETAYGDYWSHILFFPIRVVSFVSLIGIVICYIVSAGFTDELVKYHPRILAQKRLTPRADV